MKILNSREIKSAERAAIESQAISSVELIERAGAAFVQALTHRFPEAKKGVVVCGQGNNGSDGLAIASLLSSQMEISIFLFSGTGSPSPENKHFLERLPETIFVIYGDLAQLQDRLPLCDFLVDAFLGAGINRPLAGEALELVKKMNRFTGLKISVDVPSGLLLEMPENSVAFKSDWVGTFHSPKLSFFFPSNQKYVPAFDVLDIGLSDPEESEGRMEFTHKSNVMPLLKKRLRFSHKGTFGHGLLMVGSEGKMGAAVLAARAMLHSGVGLATVFCPRIGRDVLQVAVPEAMCIPDTEKQFIANPPPMGHFSSIGIGPGIGTGKATAELVKKVLERSVQPLVIDADALNILSEHKSWLSKVPQNSILTPHPKEFERLAGKSASDYEVFIKARNFAKTYSVYLVLKGAYTLVCSPEGSAWFNSTGNPGMAKGGSGDVLTGLLTGLLAQGYSSESACILGVYLHGLAGDLTEESLGQHAMLPSDVIAHFSAAFQVLQK